MRADPSRSLSRAGQRSRYRLIRFRAFLWGFCTVVFAVSVIFYLVKGSALGSLIYLALSVMCGAGLVWKMRQLTRMRTSLRQGPPQATERLG